MRKQNLLIALLFAFTYSYSQNILRGKITDKTTGESLPGASVYLSDLKKGAISDSLGNYSISNLPSGTFLIEVSSFGFTTITRSLYINGVLTENFSLEQSVAELEPVVITGVPATTLSRNNPIATAIVNKETLLENASTNIVDAISRQPGVNQVSTGSAISKPVIRGVGYNRVISLYNGVRQEGQQWGDEHGIEMDEYSIDRVEIVKGPGTIIYGPDGIGGVVNFLTPKAVPEGTIKGNILTNYQSNNHLIGYSLMNTGNIKNIEWLARVSSKTAGNYSNKYDGTVYNSGFKEFDYSGYIGTSGKWGYSQLHFSSFNQKIAMPEGNRDSLGSFTKETAINDSVTQEVPVTSNDLKGYHINIPFQYIRHNRLFWVNNFLFSKSGLRFTLGYQLNKRQEFGNIFNPSQYGFFFYLPTYTYDIRYFLPEYRGWRMTAGINGMYQRNLNKGIEFLIPEYGLFDIGAFFHIKKTFDKLTLAGGLRFDRRNISGKDLFLDPNEQPVSNNSSAFHKFNSFTNVYRNYSGTAGATYNLSEKINLKFNISRGFRAPNIAELASNGKHEGTFRYEYGNASLKAETSFQTDAGISYHSDHVSFEVSIFNNQIHNFIYAVRLRSTSGGDSIVDPGDPVPTYKYGQNNASLTGGEWILDIHPHPLDWLHFENAFSIVRGKNKNQPDSMRYLPFIPAPRYQSRIRIKIKQVNKHLSDFYLLAEADHYFRQNQYLKENHTETATPQYTLVNTGIGGNLIDQHKNVLFSVYFSANNLFNIAYQNHLSRLKYAPINPATGRMGIFNMGRNFSIKVVIPIDFYTRK